MTTETEHRHPWDDEIDSGYGWTDQLVSQWEGQAVYVTRNIDSPEQQVEHVRIVFADGSRLYLACDGSMPVNREHDAGQRDWTQVADTAATRVIGQWVKALYDNASIKELDTDL